MFDCTLQDFLRDLLGEEEDGCGGEATEGSNMGVDFLMGDLYKYVIAA